MNYNTQLILITLLLAVPISLLLLKSMGKTNIVNGIEYTFLISLVCGFAIHKAAKGKLVLLEKMHYNIIFVGMVAVLLFLFLYTIKHIIEIGPTTESGIFMIGIVILVVIIISNFYFMFNEMNKIKLL